jgi:hypothetical protein
LSYEKFDSHIGFAIILKPVFPVVAYVTNYNYITKVLCINKSKPKLQCNGKCHLMKELAKASESEKPIHSDKKDNVKQEIEFYSIRISKPGVATQFIFIVKLLLETTMPTYTFTR